MYPVAVGIRDGKELVELPLDVVASDNVVTVAVVTGLSTSQNNYCAFQSLNFQKFI